MKVNFKKLLIAVGCFAFCTAMSAQTKSLYLSSVQGTNVAQYDGQIRNVTLYRSVYNGWNTLCVPFDMTAEELDEAFGSGCKLETLSEVTRNGNQIDLYFADVKSDGVRANTPYLLHYTGDSKSVKMVANSTTIEYAEEPARNFVTDNATIKFAGAPDHIKANGQYGIYVKDNAEAAFSQVQPSTSGFYATRCYITVDGVENPVFVSHHGIDKDVTAIRSLKNVGKTDEVYNLNGTRQNGLQKGVNLTADGKKMMVK